MTFGPDVWGRLAHGRSVGNAYLQLEKVGEAVSVMNGILGFLASPAGRLTRSGLGVVLILVGVLAVTGVLAWIVAAVGVVLLAAGVFDFCVLSPLVGLPFSGPALRRTLGSPTTRST